MSVLARVRGFLSEAFAGKPKAQRQIDKEIKARSVRYTRARTSITASDIETVERDLASGNFDAFVEVARRMNRNFAWRSQMETRRDTALALEVGVEGGRPGSPQNKALEQLVKSPSFKALQTMLLDAIAIGFAGVHVTWERKTVDGRELLMPTYHQRDQRSFGFEDGEIRRRDGDFFTQLVELEPYRYIVHTPMMMPGLPFEGGLARAGMWHVMAMQHGGTGWLEATDVATKRNYITTLAHSTIGNEQYLQMVRDLASNLDSAGTSLAPPETTTVALDRNLGPLAALFKDHQAWHEQAIALLVNGQTMATLQGSSQAQAVVHQDVLKAKGKGDAEALIDTLNEWLVGPFFELNFAGKNNLPKLRVVADETAANLVKLEKLLPWATAFKTGITRGHFAEMFGLPEPENPDEPLELQQVQAASDAKQGVPDKKQPKLSASRIVDVTDDVEIVE